MKFSTAAVEKMAKNMVQEMNKLDAAGQDIRDVEPGLCEFRCEVGVQALGTSLEQQEEQLQEHEVICACGKTMTYQGRRPVTVVSVFGRVDYRCGYYLCEECHTRQSPVDRRLGIEAGQWTVVGL